MKRVLLREITLLEPTNSLHGQKVDIIIEGEKIVDIIQSGQAKIDDNIPVLVENAYISGGWCDMAMFVKQSHNWYLDGYYRKTGFRQISLIHFPEYLPDLKVKDTSEYEFKHFIPLFSYEGVPNDMRGLSDDADGWVVFLDDSIESLSNLLEELSNSQKPIVIMPFERKNPDGYSVAYETDNLWKGINPVRPEMIKAKILSLIELLKGLNLYVVSPFFLEDGSKSIIPLLSLVPATDDDGFPVKQLPPYSAEWVSLLRDVDGLIESLGGVASCNWISSINENLPWDIRSPEVFDVERTNGAITQVFKHVPIAEAIRLFAQNPMSDNIKRNTIFSFKDGRIIFIEPNLWQ